MASIARDDQGTADDMLDRFAWYPAGTEQARRAVEAGDDGRFHADLGRASVEDGVDTAFEIGYYMGGAGRADPAGAIGGRCRDRSPGRFQHGMCDRVCWNAQRDGRKPGPRQIAHGAA